MRNLIRFGFIALTIALCHSSAYCMQGPPPGSYRQTCANIQMRSGTLFANCQDTDGRWRSTVLPAAYDCAGDVTNIDGELRCNRRDNWRDRDLLPRGSYRETCRDIRRNGDTLSAKCQAINGRWSRTALYDVDHCIGEVINDDGHLQCGRRSWQARGTYVQSCAPIYVRGDDLRARCQTRDGRWVWTSLDGFERCHGDVINIDGQLRCGEGDRDDHRGGDRDDHGGGDRDRGLPRGTYVQTCKDIEIQGDRLHARCQTRDGRWEWTDLDDFRRCGDVTNVDGHLVCSR
jgi:CVNH domain